MKYKKLLFFFALLLVGMSVLAQNANLSTFNYYKADSIALNFPKSNYTKYEQIVEPLTMHLKTEQERFRAIYRWIADNVSYSVTGKSDQPIKVLIQRKADSKGYASLLKQMCYLAGLECNVIEGWGRYKPSDISESSNETEHAWNEVNINGTWYLTDLTWASGSYDEKKKKFTKNFDTTYFLPTPDFFIMQHFPDDDKNQMLTPPVKKSVFTKSCVWYRDADRYGLIVTSPKTGYISQSLTSDFTLKFLLQKPADNDTLGFSFTIDDDPKYAVKIENLSSTDKGGQSTYTLQCSFPPDLKSGIHDVTVYYAKYPVSAFRFDLH
jgi:Transglutaminase-like superfamily